MVVIPILAYSIAYRIFCSVTVSNDDVASSNNIIFGFLSKALAIAILYFSPPLNLKPLSPT